jgi:hypothetical protein
MIGTKAFDTTTVIAVLVCEQDRIDCFEFDFQSVKAKPELF